MVLLYQTDDEADGKQRTLQGLIARDRKRDHRKRTGRKVENCKRGALDIGNKKNPFILKNMILV